MCSIGRGLILLIIAGILHAAPPVPRPAPDFAFTVPSQGQRRVSDYAGKVVALEFMYTTCDACATATQEMQKLQTEFGEQDFQAIAIAIDPNAEVLAPDFCSERHLTIPVGWAFRSDAASFLGYVSSDRFVVPQIVLIDRSGVVRFQTQAQARNKEEDELRKDALLRERISGLIHPASVPRKAGNAGSR